nr:hypothetical protein CFP56_39460 [Quercus suber]
MILSFKFIKNLMMNSYKMFLLNHLSPLLIQFLFKGEFLENQIHEIDRGLSCFDTNDGDVLTSAGLNVVIPFRQDIRSDSTPSTNPCDTKINCFSIPNTSIAVSSDVSDSGSLSVGGKVVLTRRRRIVRIVSGFVISNDSGRTSVKRISEVNALDGLPRKRRAVSRKEKGDFIEILKSHEKVGRRPQPLVQMQEFRDVIDECGFQDLGFVGNKFTWHKNVIGGDTVWERLDRAVTNGDWRALFPASNVSHLECGCFDH